MDDPPKNAYEAEIRRIVEAAHHVPCAAKFFGTLETSDDIRVGDRFREFQELLWLPEGLGKDEQFLRLARALELYEGLAPSDTGEGMLALQMVGTHHAATECLRRAMIEDQSFEGRNVSLAQATKLMALYEKQLRALQKLKGKGQQKVTVEHVHVEAGGQAIVGNVEAGAASTSATATRASKHQPKSQDATPPTEIDHAPMPPCDATSRKRNKSRRKTP